MPVKLRLQRHGKKRKPFYHIVAADSRAPRDGAFIERLGFYNPNTKPATIELDNEKALDWLTKGAQPTDTVRAILRYTGVLYRKHLMRGVTKGAMSLEQADALYGDWIAKKSSQINQRIQQTESDKQKELRARDEAEKAKIAAQQKATAEAEEAAKAAEEAAKATEEEVATAEEVATTEAVVAEDTTTAVEETPTAETETTPDSE
ncbi:MAG: 30S ribosomal protein S16 [Chitinophagales bacterium]|nr:30S ribosomal protein S16 [Bacteroidota bacterium]MCB9043253.1 30S ribosomal protein S16 [Chitinophagales bacterium]